MEKIVVEITAKLSSVNFKLKNGKHVFDDYENHHGIYPPKNGWDSEWRRLSKLKVFV